MRRRIHCGIGRFCFCFFPKMRLILNDLCDGCGASDARRQSAAHAWWLTGKAGQGRRRSAGGAARQPGELVRSRRRALAGRRAPGDSRASGRRAPACRCAAHGTQRKRQAAQAGRSKTPARANPRVWPVRELVPVNAAEADAPWCWTRRAKGSCTGRREAFPAASEASEAAIFVLCANLCRLHATGVEWR